MTGYELLKHIFGIIPGRQSPPAAEATLIDWNKARELDEELDPDVDVWSLFLGVGFLVDRVVKLVDPAIQPIVERMLALPMLTLNSCSGHVDSEGNLDETRKPYLYVIFKNPAFGFEFLKVLTNKFTGYSYVSFDPDGGYAECMAGTLGPRLPLDVCLTHRLPIYLLWKFKTNHGSALFELWSRVANALDHFDQQGLFNSNPSAFRLRSDPGDEEDIWLEELLDLL